MPQGTIQSATPGSQWTGKFGNFIDYTVQLDNGGPFIISRKIKDDGSHKPVPAGIVLNYEQNGVDKQGNPKIKEVNPEFAGQSNGNVTASVNGVPLPDPRQDSIERQVAAYCAASIIGTAVANDKLPLDKATGSFDKLTNEFHKTIRGFTVEPVQQPAPSNVAAETLPPADTEGIDAPAPGDDDEIPF